MRTKCIGTIHRAWQDTVDTQFVDSLVAMAIHSQSVMCKEDEFINYTKATVSWFELGKQEGIEQALGEWIFFTDTDHRFGPDLLERLVRASKKYEARVISALYFTKPLGQHVPVAREWEDPDTPENYSSRQIYEVTDDHIQEIGPVGAGALLVYRSVFNEMAARIPNQHPFGTIPGLSEDFSFIKRCKGIGIKTYLAPRIESAHLTCRNSVSLGHI